MSSSPHLQVVENATTAEMIYEYLFGFFDSVSTGRFIVWFLLLYFSLHALVHRALLRHGRFRAADHGKQSAILVNVVEAALLAMIRCEAAADILNLGIHRYCRKASSPNTRLCFREN